MVILANGGYGSVNAPASPGCEDRAATAGVGRPPDGGQLDKGGNCGGSLVDPSGAIAEGSGKRLRRTPKQ